MSVQRRRGETALVYPLVWTADNRGNRLLAPAFEAEPTPVRAAIVPERSSRAEVPGQQQINVVKMIVDGGTPDIHLWGYVEAHGKKWDIAAPPEFHRGTRRTRHWSVTLRERPS